ncbi:hypothetical protein [Tabrizicola sp.]|uniref:hypothetical protein n=1 Tax=Tabrizicola sp. TaxID=2005166 RepID=UPI003F2ABB0A
MTTARAHAFPLAVLAARVMAWALLAIGIVGGGAWVIRHGPGPGFSLMAGNAVEALVLFAFAYFLRKGSAIAAILFGFWCLWGLLQSFAGAADPIVFAVLYALGILNFIGIAGVVKGFTSKAPS